MVIALHDILRQTWLVPVLALLGVVVALLAAAGISVDSAQRLLVEGGPVEIVSAALQFLVAAIALLLWTRRGGLFGLLAIASFLMGAREIDLHTAFTTHGIFSTKEYFRPGPPLLEKILAGSALLVVLALVVGGVLASWKELARLARARNATIIGLATIVLLLPVLKLFDALPRMAREVGMPVGEVGVKYLLAVEELGELMLPVLMLVVLVQLRVGRNSHAVRSPDAPSLHWAPARRHHPEPRI